MDQNASVTFLFNISKEIKRSFESPVVFITFKDYANGIYESLLEIRDALQHNATTDKIGNIVNNFHLDWLRAVREIEDVKKRLKDTPREMMQNAIDFTIKCVHNRYTNFKNFQQNLKIKMSIENRLVMQADLEIMKDMKETVISVLEEKKTCFKYNADNTEYLVKATYEVEELLNWLDRLNDSLAIQFSRVINLHVPQLPSDLTKTLHQIIVAVSTDPKTVRIVEKMESQGKLLCSMIRVNASHDLEVSKVVEKIKVLEDRIERLKEENSSAVLALQHKVIYLEERLQSLENLKQCLNVLKTVHSKEIGDDDVLDSTELHIFNHNLPHADRCRLVERLVKLWDTALGGYDHDAGKSTISILSAVDLKEVYEDDMGQFIVDEYGRKLYASASNTLYQLNENNELVEVNDDAKHVYFYDDCGRYYLSESRTRIYKAHSDASEYELAPTGKLLKLRETVDGVEYKYDNDGRYFINELGKRIYCDVETGEKYEQDGFGNLVRIHSENGVLNTCPSEPIVIEECRYLKGVVGDALKKCLASVLLHQPADPIGFLADSLVKYWQNIEARQKRKKDKEELDATREYSEAASAPDHSYDTEEEQTTKSNIDTHFQNYKTEDYNF